MSCEKLAQVQAYYDGELPSGDARALEAHLERCEECRTLLAELEALTARLSSAARGQMRPGAMSRFKGAWSEARDRMIIRIASWATAAAAALVLGVTLMWPEPSATNLRAGSWEPVAAMTPDAITATGASSEADTELVEVAQWMTRGLGEGR